MTTYSTHPKYKNFYYLLNKSYTLMNDTHEKLNQPDCAEGQITGMCMPTTVLSSGRTHRERLESKIKQFEQQIAEYESHLSQMSNRERGKHKLEGASYLPSHNRQPQMQKYQLDAWDYSSIIKKAGVFILAGLVGAGVVYTFQEINSNFVWRLHIPSTQREVEEV